MEKLEPLKRNGLCGGRSRARTADLLLVRHEDMSHATDSTERVRCLLSEQKAMRAVIERVF